MRGPTKAARTTRSAASGFTLIEVLVALVIMALMSVMAWRAVSALSTTKDVTETHMDNAETIQTLVRQWELDLREVQDSKQVTALAFDGATLRLTRRANGGLQIVSWQLRDGRLIRWASPAVTTVSALQDAWFRSQQLSADELRGSPGIGGVTGWQMYFFRNNAWSNAQSSDDETSTTVDTGSGSSSSSGSSGSGAVTPTITKTKLLPSGVRMKLQFGGDGPYQGEITREVLVPAGGTR